MLLWVENASKAHRERGHLIRSKHTAKQLKTLSVVLRRIKEDEYDVPNKVFTSRNNLVKANGRFDGEDFEYLDLKYQNRQRQADIDFAFDMVKHRLLDWWD
jgi:hypothetical protein